MLERQQSQDENRAVIIPMPQRKRKRTRKASTSSNKASPVHQEQLEVLDWGKKVTARANELERKAQIALAKSDRQTSDLYRLNRRINDMFCKIMVEKSQKETSQNKEQNAAHARKSSTCSTATNDKIREMEDELRVMRDKHRNLVRLSKKSLIQAKRLFTLGKRVSDGYIKSELDENTTRYRRGNKKHIGRECAVCIDDITASDRALQVEQCGHVLHEECFDSWIELHTTCPVCRTELEPQVDQQELPQQITDTISWADMTTTNISAI